MDPVRIGDATLYRGDALGVLRTLPAASVHCCVSSPPYFGLRDYNVAGQIGLEKSPEAYIERLVEVFREVRRVLRPDGVVFLNLGDCYAGSSAKGWRPGNPNKNKGNSNRDGVGAVAGLKPKDLMMMPARVALALQADGWYLRSEIIWHKLNPMPESVSDRCTSAHEKIFMLCRSATYYYDAEAIKEPCSPSTKERADRGYKVGGTNAPDRNDRGQITRQFSAASRNRRNVWSVATCAFKGAHFATMPSALIEPCILAGTSEHGVCGECGAPWVRMVERSFDKAAASKIAANRNVSWDASRKDSEFHQLSGFEKACLRTTIDRGWRPTCSCDAGVVPAVVLDCFAGAGTTALVAGRLGRRSIGIELNGDYLELTRQRLEAANDNKPAATVAELTCRLGWTAGCPYRSCERAGACMAPAPANDNEPNGPPVPKAGLACGV